MPLRWAGRGGWATGWGRIYEMWCLRSDAFGLQFIASRGDSARARDKAQWGEKLLSGGVTGWTWSHTDVLEWWAFYQLLRAKYKVVLWDFGREDSVSLCPATARRQNFILKCPECREEQRVKLRLLHLNNHPPDRRPLPGSFCQPRTRPSRWPRSPSSICFCQKQVLNFPFAVFANLQLAFTSAALLSSVLPKGCFQISPDLWGITDIS